MLAYYKYENGVLQEVADIDSASVIRAVSPTGAEIELMHRVTDTPLEFLSAANDRDERPRVERENGHKLTVIRVPVHNDDSDMPFTTIALAIILAPEHVITVCSEPSQVWQEMINIHPKLPSPHNHFMFATSFFMLVARQYLQLLSKIREESTKLEGSIHFEMKNETLLKMLQLEKCLVFFTTSLRANEPIWDRFRRMFDRSLSDDEQDSLDDIKIEFNQAKELADIYNNILNGMMEAFASIISNNQSAVIKSLTLATIMLMLPTLVASIYGMNIALPFQQSPHAFAYTSLIATGLVAAGVAIFLKKRWL